MNKKSSLTALALMALCSTGHSAVISGDIAIIARQNNGAPADVFSIVALAPLSPGDVIYFTDNGWNQGTDTTEPVPGPPSFRSQSATDGNGAEQLMQFTVLEPISAGTIISSIAASTAWNWDVSSLPQNSDPGGNFTPLALANTGDQIYAFTAPNNDLPLNHVSSMIYLLDDTGSLEDATSAATGSAGSLVVGQTAVVVDRRTAGTISLNMSDPDVIALQAAGGTKGEWLSVISNSSNWNLTASAQPTGSFNVVPEPGITVLVWACGAVFLMRRRMR